METPYIYTDLNEVPLKWRKHKGARLSLEHINSIIKKAYEKRLDTEHGSIPDYGGARVWFEKTHAIENNLWVLSK